MAEKSLLVTAAKIIGKGAGKVARIAGADEEQASQAPGAQSPQRKGKLPKKKKSRLPRRAKKAQRKQRPAA